MIIFDMMTGAATQQQPGRILYSCYQAKSRVGEHFVPDHVLGYIESGTYEVFIDGKNHVFQAGDIRFFRRNQLARFTKIPPENDTFKSISIFIDQATLRSIAAEYQLYMDKPYTGDNALHLKPVKLLQHYFDSLLPYLQEGGTFRDTLMHLKMREAVLILLQTNPDLKNVLFDFSEPGKIDLEAYMNEHYKFNVDLNRYAYLTGRSLATFKRDFERIFHTSPSRWLQQKRLQDAHYLLREKGWRASDVYLEVGFKDLSHFSYAFKKTFGIPPSSLSSV
ncbi:helix-turn-helix domain-containing protein [Chitinophaga nivalis]|uniref:AraC family transcriptional regulator n=1 Tax=Chitinophaga nivalis TaxID=2991709 RepID=A0ABT3IK48_9BACT|nr:AraC family transcriptional regulator [Chitinophaga nivalis]MCW3465990.1 AraC family transcriptional regulator [Chitinophaga nivalis]MCW3484319.1 AraC family transcriptional regulator [Chitinophaga nivalis]